MHDEELDGGLPRLQSIKMKLKRPVMTFVLVHLKNIGMRDFPSEGLIGITRCIDDLLILIIERYLDMVRYFPGLNTKCVIRFSTEYRSERYPGCSQDHTDSFKMFLLRGDRIVLITTCNEQCGENKNDEILCETHNHTFLVRRC